MSSFETIMRRAALVVLAVGVLAVARPAWAHDVRGEIIFLDVGDRVVDMELRVPVLQLALARGETIDQLLVEPTAVLAADARANVTLRDRAGTPFASEVRGVALRKETEGKVFVFSLRFTPPAGGSARWFELADQLVLRTVVTDNIYVFVRRDLQGGEVGVAPTLVGTMHYQQLRLVVNRTAGSWRTSLAAAVHLGVDHIREGTDHLLFLLLLLVVAPLTVANRRWSTAASSRRGLVRTAGIATAFTLGHSATLALGAVGGVTLPSRVVECAIAISILVSALHAWRPLFAGREPLVAGVFGLVHGLAFATALAGFGFDRGSLVLALLGFNLGVELMQLAVIAVVVPSLLVIARHGGYGVVRRGASAIAVVASGVWLVERSAGVTLLSSLFDRAARHGVVVVVLLASAALVSWVASLSLRSSLKGVSP